MVYSLKTCEFDFVNYFVFKANSTLVLICILLQTSNTLATLMSSKMNELLPKHLTGVSDLISRTGCNGQDVTVAVLDTGVDPGAAGLQRTPDGLPKVIDMIDCTGSGDVDMSTIRKSDKDNSIVGVSGRALKLGSEICDMNPSNEFHVGCKSAYELLPRALVSRIKSERRKLWKKANKDKLNAVFNSITDASMNEDIDKSSKKLLIEELEAQKDVLIALESNYEDVGPIYDCITFFDGNMWKCAVDSGEAGDFGTCTILEDYHINCKYGTINNGVIMNFGVNIYDDGNLLSIVVDCGSHGTHVAGIIGAYYPESPEMNGIAPGSKIVSLKIGDTRLDGMETHRGLMKAMGYLLEHSFPNGLGKTSPRGIHIDVANMSYGEPTGEPNKGKFTKAMNTLVYKHNVMFLASAGNSGPALSSVGAPGGTTEAVMGVGAYVTPEMLKQTYSVIDSDVAGNLDPTSYATCTVKPTNTTNELNNKTNDNIEEASEELSEESLKAIPYTWCSRGPAFDGSIGVSICAPGGAIAPVPRWSLEKKQKMHGTSMSSPSAAGTVAVILSFLKKKSILYSTPMLRRAIEHTAKPLLLSRLGSGGEIPKEDYYKDLVFAGGAGSIDANAVSFYLENMNNDLGSELQNKSSYERILGSVSYWNYKVRVSTLSGGRTVRKPSAGIMNTTRGVYLRGHTETRTEHRFEISVAPSSPDNDDELSKIAKTNMELFIDIETSCSWVKAPKALVMVGSNRAFPIVVDPTNLKSGVHFAQVFGYLKSLSGNKGRGGPLFKVPITVTKPEDISGGNMVSPVTKMRFSAGAVLRRFYEVPIGATYAKLTIKTSSKFSKSTKIPNKDSEIPVAVPQEHITSRIGENVISNEFELFWSPSKDSRNFEVHTVQSLPLKSHKETSSRHSFILSPNSYREVVLKVYGGNVIELCLAQTWSSPGETFIDKVEMEFCGITVQPPMLISMPMSNCFKRIEISNQLLVPKHSNDSIITNQRFVQNASINTVQRPTAPKKSTLSVLGSRYKLPGFGTISQMKLEYTFEVHENSSSVQVNFPDLNGSVQEAEILGGPFTLIMDSNGRLLHKSDIRPERVNLFKGTYFIDAYLAHENSQILHNLRELKANISYRLSKIIELNAYDSPERAVTNVKSGKNTMRPRSIEYGECISMIVSAPSQDQIPSWVQSGDVLKGNLVVDNVHVPKANYKPKYGIMYVINKRSSSPEISRKNLSNSVDKFKRTFDKSVISNTPTSDSDISDEKWFSQEILNIKTKRMKGLLCEKKFKNFDDLLQGLKMEDSATLELRVLCLHRFEIEALSLDLTQNSNILKFKDTIAKAMSFANEIVSSINEPELAANLYLNREKYSKDCESFKKYKAIESSIIIALFIKARMMERVCEKDLTSSEPAKGHYNKEYGFPDFEKAYQDLCKWLRIDGQLQKISSGANCAVNIAGADIAILAAKREYIRKRYGSSLKILDTYFNQPENKQYLTVKVCELRERNLQGLSWIHAKKYENNRKIIAFPSLCYKY